MAEPDRSGAGRDLLFLALATVLAAGHATLDLGFYEDDWAFLADLEGTVERTFGGYWRALAPHDQTVRPVQFLLLSGLYRLFGLAPLPYHVAQLAIVLTAVGLLYLLLRRLGVAPAGASAAALLWGILPHHSTARVWVAAAQIPLSAAAFFAHALALLRAADSGGGRRAAWLAAAFAAALVSLLSYEIFLPLLLAMPLLVHWRFRSEAGRGAAGAGGRAVESPGGPIEGTGAPILARRRPFVGGAALWLPSWGAAALGLALKAAFSERVGSATVVQRVGRGARTYWRILPEHLYELGVRLPITYVDALRDVGLAAQAGPILAAMLTFFYLRKRPLGTPPVGAVGLMGAAAATYFLGYAMAFLTGGVGTATLGPANRTAVASSIAVALLLTGAAWGLARRAPRPSLIYAGVIGTAVFAFGGIDAAVNAGWGEAARRQEVLLGDLRVALAGESRARTVLIGGVCPYVGPAAVMVSDWGATGAVRLALGRPEIRADVVSPTTRVATDVVVTELMGSENRYPFTGLYGFDAVAGTARALPDSAAAARFVEAASGASRCPARPREGGPLFP